MNYPAAELRSIKMDFCPINPDAEHRGILLINNNYIETFEKSSILVQFKAIPPRRD
jgi:hypothetical protein